MKNLDFGRSHMLIELIEENHVKRHKNGTS